jgi:hypothetical protein
MVVQNSLSDPRFIADKWADHKILSAQGHIDAMLDGGRDDLLLEAVKLVAMRHGALDASMLSDALRTIAENFHRLEDAGPTSNDLFAISMECNNRSPSHTRILNELNRSEMFPSDANLTLASGWFSAKELRSLTPCGLRSLVASVVDKSRAVGLNCHKSYSSDFRVLVGVATRPLADRDEGDDLYVLEDFGPAMQDDVIDWRTCLKGVGIGDAARPCSISDLKRQISAQERRVGKNKICFHQSDDCLPKSYTLH